LRDFAPIVDTLVKERLTGAVILVALIVVLVPELLTGPIRPTARVHGPAPSSEEPPLRSYTIDLADEARGGSGSLRPQPASAAPAAATAADSQAAAALAAGAPAQPSAVASAQAAPPATQPPLPTTSTPARSSPPAAPPAATAAVPATSAMAYVVQLGSFANRSNAEGLAKRVRALGFTVTISRGTTGRHLYRVQVPARDRAAAEQILSKLRSQGHPGSLMPR